MNSRLDTYVRRARRSFFLGPARKPVGVRSVDDEPGRLVAHRARLTALSAAIALGLPVVAGVALIPLRPHLAQSISLIMVVLVAVGIVTGFIADAAQGAVESTRVRHRELTALTDFLARVGRSDPGELIDEAGRSISALLLALECRWQPGYRGTASPVLNPTGTITVSGVGKHLDSSAARLPSDLEIPWANHRRNVAGSSSARRVQRYRSRNAMPLQASPPRSADFSTRPTGHLTGNDKPAADSRTLQLNPEPADGRGWVAALRRSPDGVRF